jgi:hypothetical protein
MTKLFKKVNWELFVEALAYTFALIIGVGLFTFAFVFIKATIQSL